MAAPENPDQESKWLEDLPKAISCGMTLRLWKGFWLPEPGMNALRRMDAHFLPLPDDILVTSFPRTGTTWLMALTYAILHRRSQLRKTHDGENIDLNDDDPLLTQNPHELILSLEYRLYRESANLDLEHPFSSPRIFQTHLSYTQLSVSVKQSGCRIIYIARNPKDTLVSFWHYWNTNPRRPNVSLGELFDAFCKGTVVHGDFHDHVLDYWKERDKVFFITYEELTEDPFKHVKRLAEFLGYSLTSEEVKGIVWRCSFQRLSTAEGNNGGRVDYFGFPFSSYFRKGKMGDWKNHLTPEMVEMLDEITQRKLMGTGLELSS
ncbi:cytosolic sulfotransferase 8-like [Aristolochia californica]|uniref:cytosolic sulfotransferase 8-like n=1 Tax=Aristolochia californica TaxID=171875 RepID=UPI0035E17563